jgi:hypothetical protein
MDVLATNPYFVLVLDLSFANGDVELRMVSSNSRIKWELFALSTQAHRMNPSSGPSGGASYF